MTKSKRPVITEFNCETQQEIVREMTDAEFAQYEKDQAEIAARKAAEAEKIASKQIILDRLGLTADEAKLLLG